MLVINQMSVNAGGKIILQPAFYENRNPRNKKNVQKKNEKDAETKKNVFGD